MQIFTSCQKMCKYGEFTTKLTNNNSKFAYLCMQKIRNSCKNLEAVKKLWGWAFDTKFNRYKIQNFSTVRTVNCRQKKGPKSDCRNDFLSETDAAVESVLKTKSIVLFLSVRVKGHCRKNSVVDY